MDKGKVKESILDRSILKIIENRREEVIAGASVAQDASVFSMKNNKVTVVSTNPVTYNFTRNDDSKSETGKEFDNNFIRLGVAQVVNGVIAQGGEPVGLMCTIFMPEKLREIKLKMIMREIEAQCKVQNIELCGGHTEVTDNVIQPMISFTCIGQADETSVKSAKRITPKMDIVMTKWIGLSGTKMILSNRREELEQRFQRSFLDRMNDFDKYYTCDIEGNIANLPEYGVVAMHDVGVGGIKGALWEIASAAKVGIEVHFDKIGVKQETIELCEFCGLNPYEMYSTGVMLMVTNNGEKLVDRLREEGIVAEVIGNVTEDNDRVIIKNDDRRFLTPPIGDEIYKL